jgi:cation diffusion facilitator CzcD-associated flavoprotein CzcO
VSELTQQIVWSHLYSLSFEPNARWSREYPTQPEIQKYLAGVARKYQLERNIRFGSEVEDCLFDPASGLWSTRARDGSTYRSRYLVSAVGQLNSPQLPDVAGLQNFRGKAMHSARWDKSYDLTGKTVAVIGNGMTWAYPLPSLAEFMLTTRQAQRPSRSSLRLPRWQNKCSCSRDRQTGSRRGKTWL